MQVSILGSFLSTIGLMAHADGFCGDLEALVEQAGSNSPPTTSIMTMGLPSSLSTQTKCTTSLSQTGARAVNCAWPFAYRSDEAQAAFDGILSEVRKCLGADAIVSRDQGVNHPDFYDLREFRFQRGEVGVSIKDKGALQQTYVFLRVQGLPL